MNAIILNLLVRPPWSVSLSVLCLSRLETYKRINLWNYFSTLAFFIFFYYGSGLRIFSPNKNSSLMAQDLNFFFQFFSTMAQDLEFLSQKTILHLWLSTQNFFPKQQFFTYGSGLGFFWKKKSHYGPGLRFFFFQKLFFYYGSGLRFFGFKIFFVTMAQDLDFSGSKSAILQVL